MPWECYECAFIQDGSPSGKGPCIVRMHDNPLRVKVEVEDAGASPSPAPKITGMMVKTKALMSNVASLQAFVEAVMVESAVVAAATESAVAAAAVTMMGIVRGGSIQGRCARNSLVLLMEPLCPPWTSWRRAVHLWIVTLLGRRLRLLVQVSCSRDDCAMSTMSADHSFARVATSASARHG